MPFEVGEDNGEIIVFPGFAHIVFLEVFSTVYGEGIFPFGIHNHHRGDSGESMVRSGLQVVGRMVAAAVVGCVALHDGAVQLLHKWSYEFRVEMIVVARLACGEFHGHLAFGFASEGFIHLLDVFRSDILDEINDGCVVGGGCCWLFGGCRGSFRTATCSCD